MRTTVGIIGAGPAGLLLARLLHNAGIDSVVLESRDRAYVEQRQRAGILEHGTVDVLRAAGAGGRMDREGLRHDGIELRFARERHRVDFPALTGGSSVMVYAQTEVCKDLIALQLEEGGPLLFGAEALAVEGAESERPRVRFRHEGREDVLECDYVVGCDGFWGVARRAIPAEHSRVFERTYPFGWLGILADVPPSHDELVYARHDRGFALLSMRSPVVSRLYLQVPEGTDAGSWADEEIWDELERRLETADGWSLERGTITSKSVTPMRSHVHEPMRHGRLFLAGDAAHIVPPTGAKGLNLAVGDVVTFARALVHLEETGSAERLDAYSETCLRRVWQAERFSYDMTTLLHRAPDATPFEDRVQLARLRRIATSRAAETDLAEGYTGFPLD
ncbi:MULTISPECIES: 4-hydroxybenzoate 3-monooxygenase [unclassified Streptomyces]|uniref:4-hydroxybenzoate 3-monooxygenase n=1 Tax=unclassified Streptomyces TaxID=2593676 RepID=UPI0011635787|nr:MULTISPECIES: 4-hydroxybenzoate 3-monooxygenase [unclassified Streptomyces]NMI58842.1 4-hydroxybenzoate 3-monooxygenase [Streptomyces sp. RLA2-12]QDN58144.1 4-hydroxybenzoate 3-monooxygenase [Streptomyces sp. S1D4-20]QDN68239.1 4-hydroxybenzoate 3-monooxygenase [Streptomyces sp. S1D4-14]QDO50655.1 4-hydroxybenzoate 3-monooxygenase [Streptomyces sp. RLB3-5]QDO60895.1 4-hydroxybenzoate 3-monooxygenase [Streptomyces sp. RLB1-8]